MANIHPTAVIGENARIAADVTIGPFCVIDSDSIIEAGCRLASHVVVKPRTHLGPKNEICEGAVLGGKPQHLRAGERVGRVQIGSENCIRENVTIHCGLGEEDATVIGDRNLIMVNAHVGHDCLIGNQVILANNVMIAGHVTVEDRAYISGAVGVHQFCRVGQLAMVGGQSHVSQDVPPFMMVDGISNEIVGLNRIGLRRNGFSADEVLQLKNAYRVIYRSNLTWNEILDQLQSDFSSGPAATYFEFLSNAKRGIVRERRGPIRSTLRVFAGDSDEEISKAARTAG